MSGPGPAHRASRGPEHQRCLELAAAAMDFQLSPAEEQLVRTHLAVCPSCEAIARGMRSDASTLAATPLPPAPVAVREAVIGAAMHQRGPRWTRWSVVLVALLVTVVIGSVAGGAMVDRLRTPVQPIPTAPTAIVRTTPVPEATAVAAPRGGWQDLGALDDELGGRTVRAVLAAPGGGLLALGLERTTADPVVWTSDDGQDWTLQQPSSGVFGGGVPTSGALAGPGMLVVGWDVSVEQGQQRAIWQSTDGRSWALSPDRSALLGTQETDLTMASGPAGTIVWAPSGKVWVSLDGRTWSSGSVGHAQLTDVAVADDRFVAVGVSGTDAFLTTSTNGQSWSALRTTPAATDTQVGIERSADGLETIWVGDQRWQRTGTDWRAVPDASQPRVPDVTNVVGGATDIVAVGAPTSGAMYRAWTWDGGTDWVAQRTAAEPGSATPSVVAVAPHGEGWFVLTRRDGALHGWSVAP